jgi:hypothetical protein
MYRYTFRHHHGRWWKLAAYALTEAVATVAR